jgi:large conductance mechanosensitive channel
MGMIKEFREFAIKGNMMDMAVGIIIGAAFGTVVKSLVDDILMPPFGLLLGNVDFSNLFFVLKNGAAGIRDYATLADAKADGAVTINYGLFVNSIISFIIVAFALFMLIKNMNRLKRERPAPEPAPTAKFCPQCYSTIHIKAVRCPNCTSTLQS